MEMESRDSGEQLREMAEKVFQLLERLKLAELAKNKAMEVRFLFAVGLNSPVWLTRRQRTKHVVFKPPVNVFLLIRCQLRCDFLSSSCLGSGPMTPTPTPHSTFYQNDNDDRHMLLN